MGQLLGIEMLGTETGKGGEYQKTKKVLKHKNKPALKSTTRTTSKLKRRAAFKQHRASTLHFAKHAYNHTRYVHVQKERRTKGNQHSSPFLRLPGEIRNMIYSHVFGGEGGTYSFVRTTGLRAHLAHDTPDANRLALLRVCRQIHHEAASLPFQLNTFQFDSLYTFSLLSERLANSQRRHITKLQIDVDVKSCYEVTDFLAEVKEQQATFAMLYPSVRGIELSMLDIMWKEDWANELSYKALTRADRLGKWMTTGGNVQFGWGFRCALENCWGH